MNVRLAVRRIWSVAAAGMLVSAAGTTLTASPREPSAMLVQAPPGPFGKIAPANGASVVLSQANPTPTLSWSASSGATSYQYCIDTSNDNACSTWIDVGSSLSVDVAGLSYATTYYWNVRAVNGAAVTNASNGASPAYWSFMTSGSVNKSSPGNGVTGVTSVATLSWSSVSSGMSYEYCYDTTDDNVCAAWIPTGQTTSATLSGLAPSTTYYWHVRGSGVGGTLYSNGSSSAFWSFTTYSGAPGAFSKSSPSDGSTNQPPHLGLSWTASTGAEGYEYCYDTTNDGACSPWISTGTNRSVQPWNFTPSTTYYWSVRATNPGGTTYANGGQFWTFTTMPGSVAFTKTGPADGSTGLTPAPSLSWTALADAYSYDYCYDTTNDGACSSWHLASSNTSAQVAGLAGNTTYYWQVRAASPWGVIYADGGAASFASFTTALVAPGTFNKLSPPGSSTDVSTSPTLTWSSSAGAAGYEYCYDTTNDGACSVWIDVGSSTSVVLSNLNAATWYYWQVRATNAAGVTYAGGNPGVFSHFSTAGAPPAPFHKSSPADGATNLAQPFMLSWFPSPGVVSYEYCYDTTNDGTCSNWTSSTSWQSNLTANTTYYWQARATNAYGTTYADGDPTAFWSFTTFAGPPGAFSKSFPGTGSANAATPTNLYWSNSLGATDYEYCYDTTDDGTCASWSQTSGTGVNLGSLQRGTTYYWQVRANGPQGPTYANGDPTAFWSFTTVPEAPGAFGKLSPADGAVGQSAKLALSWAASAGATSYEYCYDTTNDNVCSGWRSVGTNTSTAPAFLQVGTTYYWHVRAVNPGGTTYADGASTSTWAFTTAAVPKVDFNGDGKVDLLFESSTGALYAWFMDGPIRIGGGFLSQSPVDPNLRVVGVRDFTGDGKTDLLLQDQTNGAVTLHVMDGLTKIGEQAIPIAVNTPWRIVATGDVNGDGHPDIVWQHSVPVPGQVYVWFMAPQNGMAGFGGPSGAFAGDYVRDFADAIVSTSLRVVGAGDFSNDGKLDLVLESLMSGSRFVWRLDGTRFVGQVSPTPPTVDPLWKTRAIADYSADGHPDFIWQHVVSGGLYYWQMIGLDLAAHGYLWTSAVNPIWTIVGPR